MRRVEIRESIQLKTCVCVEYMSDLMRGSWLCLGGLLTIFSSPQTTSAQHIHTVKHIYNTRRKIFSTRRRAASFASLSSFAAALAQHTTWRSLPPRWLPGAKVCAACTPHTTSYTLRTRLCTVVVGL